MTEAALDLGVTESAALDLQLAERIRAEHAAAGAALKGALKHAIHAGELLLEAKAMVGHGQWLPWLEANCQMSARTAQAYMRIATRLGRLAPQYAQRVADLSVRAALRAVANPRMMKAIDGEEERDESVAESTGRRVGAGLPAAVLAKMHSLGRKRIRPVRDDVFAWLQAYGLGAEVALAWFRQASTVQRLRHFNELLAMLSEAEVEALLGEIDARQAPPPR